MLKNAKIMAFTGTRDAARAKTFYRDQLGLTLVEENSFALVFDAGGTMLRVTNVPELTPAQFTVLGWEVPDITGAVRDLAAKGVAFSRYPGMVQDSDGVWTSPAGARVAWFSDPDGNILSLTQFTAA
ncbi:MAG TPA: VOC family protein [Bryobacteraceae bacterium]|nr:VOC family protein [Bryobacteraceae bacterium]